MCYLLLFIAYSLLRSIPKFVTRMPWVKTIMERLAVPTFTKSKTYRPYVTL